jgi:hypothetical protein
MLVPLLLPSLSPARAADVERSELPPLPGADPAALGEARPTAQPHFAPSPPPGLAPPPNGPAVGASPLPQDLWRGADAHELERLLAAAPLPSPSPVLAGLIARALAGGDQPSGEEIVLRVSALERAGRVAEATELLGRAGAHEPRLLGPYALALLASGRVDEACEVQLGEPGTATGTARREALLVPAYCAAARGDAPGAKLALQLAHEGGADIVVASAVLGQRQPAIPKSVGVMDYLFLSLAEKRPTAALGGRAEPPLLFLLARDETAPAELRAEAALREGVELAMKGGLPPALLHRLVTVLDGLDYDVPIPLWDEAGKTPQPGDGDLPAIGALTGLKQAADAGEVGCTVLMVAAVLGPNGAKGAHLIALGDSLHALKCIGLDAEARRLGFEALYAHWPSRRKA